MLVDGSLAEPYSAATTIDVLALARWLRVDAIEVAVDGPAQVARALRSRAGDIAVGRLGVCVPAGIAAVPLGAAAHRMASVPEHWWMHDDDDAWRRQIARWVRWRRCLHRLPAVVAQRTLGGA